MTSIYIETYGCSLNFSDSERMAGLLKQAKFEIIENEATRESHYRKNKRIY